MTFEIPKVKVGSLLITAKPFAYVLSSNLQIHHEHCDTCLRKSDEKQELFRCANCHLVYYCDRTCQKRGWDDGHKWECRPFTIHRQVPPGFSRLLYRVIAKLQTNKIDIYDIVEKKIHRRFRDLMSHYPEIQADRIRMEQIQCSGKVVESLIRHQKGLVMPNETELIITCGKILVNTFSITDPEIQQVGTGLYLGPSIFDHSCEPMAVATFHSTTIQIRNIVEIPLNLPLDKVSICYRDAIRPTILRRAELQTSYYFTCQCERCTYPKWDQDQRVFICGGRCKQEIFIEKSPICPNCSMELSESRLEKFKETESMVQLKLDEMHQIQSVNKPSSSGDVSSSATDLDVAETCMKLMKAEGFSDTHWQMVAMSISAFESSIDMKLWKKSLEYGRLALKGYRKYLSPNHPLLGITALKLAKLCWFMEREEEARNFVLEAKDILTLTHGISSPFMIHTVLPLVKEIITTMAMHQNQH